MRSEGFFRSGLLVSLLVGSIALAAPVQAELSVVSSSQDALVLDWKLPELAIERFDHEGRSYQRPVFPQAMFLGEPDEADLPSLIRLVGLPQGGSTRVRVSGVQTREVVIDRVAPVARPVPETVGTDTQFTRAYASSAIASQPLPWARLDGMSSLRGQRVGRLVVSPCRLRDDSRTVEWVTRMRIEIQFDLPEEAAFTRVAGRDSRSWEATLDQSLLNASVARQWRKVRDRSQTLRSGGTPSFSSSSNWLKVTIETPGLHTLDYFTFSNAGVDPAMIDPTTVRVFAGTNLALPESLTVARGDFMTECAILDIGDQDAVFDLEDRFLFYALSANGWGNEFDATRSRTERIDNDFADETYYWITWGGSFPGPPRRMGTRSVAPGAGPFAGSQPHRVHFERNNIEDFRYSDEDGWMWEDLRGRGNNRLYFVSLDDVAPSRTGSITARLASYTSQPATENQRVVELKIDSSSGPILADTTWTHSRNSAIIDLTGPATTLRSGSNTIVLNVDTSGEGRDGLYLSHFDIEYDRTLRASGGHLHWFADPGSADFEATGFSANEVFLFDVSDQHAPVRLTGGVTSGTDEISLQFTDSASSSIRWYVATTLSGTRAPSEVVTPNLRDLRNPSNAAEYIIVYHPRFEAGAERLAQIRRTFPGWENLPIVTVNVEDVYDEFSWGMKDVNAIRDFLKYAYDNWIGDPGSGDSRPCYAALVGDATYDTRPYLSGSPENLLPSFAFRYRTQNPFQYDAGLNLGFYTTEDFFGYLEADDYQNPLIQPGLDMAIGRFPVRTVEEMNLMLDKLEAYANQTQPGQWLNRVIVVADDERTLDPNVREVFHTVQAEDLSRLGFYPEALDKVKVYLTEFPRNAFGRKPSGQDMFIDEFTRGALLVSYTGHGDQNTMAQEEVFVSQKIPELKNEERLPVFTTFSCTVSKFDLLSSLSMTEGLLLHEGGGAVATFSSGSLVFPAPSFNLHTAWLSEMFGTPYPVDTYNRSLRSIGLAATVAKSIVGNNNSNRSNNEKYLLLGDPALTLRFGKFAIEFDTNTVETNFTDGLLRVIRGSVFDESGNVLDGTAGTTAFNGTAFLHVTENADTSGYLFDSGFIPYELDGPTTYRGEVPVTNGRFEARFYVSETVPSGDRARVSAFALEDNMVRAASGAVDSLVMAPTISPAQTNDTAGPEIVVGFEGSGRLENGDLIFTDMPILDITLRDESGIVLRPFPQFQLLQALIDSLTLVDLSQDFSYMGDGFTEGRVRRILPLPDGEHNIVVKAFDNVGNGGEANITFTIVTESPGTVLESREVAFYPNPFVNTADLTFTLRQAAEVVLKIFTISGRKIFESLPQMAEQGEGNRIRWNGLDSQGNPLANGTYLYKLEATATDTGVTAEKVGKVVKLR